MKRLVVAGVILALVVPAAGTAAPSVKAIAAARERAAARKAEKLLLSVRLPAGAERLSHIPIHDPAMTTPVGGVSIDTMSARRYGFWRSRESLALVLRFVEAHPVWGLTENGGGPESVTFYGNGSPMQRAVGISLVRARGWTFIRVDASTAWIYPRSPAEKLPAGIREIDIRGGGVSRHLTNPAQVARVAHWFGMLGVVPPHAYAVSCDVAVLVSPETFLFRAASGKVVARAMAVLGASSCDPNRFWIGGKEQTPLIDITGSKDAFLVRVERMLGVCFGAGPRGGRRPTPACNKQWAQEEATQLLHRLRLPAGAQALAKEPRGDGGLLRAPQSTSGGSELVDQHRFWRVRAPLASVEAFVEHERHAQRTGSGTVGGPGVPPNRSVTFTYVPRNGIVASRGLEITLVTLPDGSTGVRADAQVVWIYPRTIWAPPARVGEVIVVRAGSTTRRITDLQTVERITLRFNRLEVVQPGTIFHCPGVRLGRKVTIEFHGVDPAVTERAVAYGNGLSTVCNPIAFVVRGRTTPLVGRDFVRWLGRVLGVRLG